MRRQVNSNNYGRDARAIRDASRDFFSSQKGQVLSHDTTEILHHAYIISTDIGNLKWTL